VPKPIATWNPARDVWETDQACIFGHWAEFSETWPASGMTRRGTALPLPASAHPTAGTGYSSSPGLLPTPSVADGLGGHMNRSGDRKGELLLPGVVRTLLPTPTVSDTNGPGTHGDGGADLRTAVTMLPTLLPACNPNDGETVETWEARRLATKERVGNGNGFGTPLSIAVQLVEDLSE